MCAVRVAIRVVPSCSRVRLVVFVVWVSCLSRVRTIVVCYIWLPPPCPKELRGTAWGKNSLAPVFRNTAGAGKVQIGWGATCGCHANYDDVEGVSTRCQKQITTLSGARAVPNDEALRLAKVWLLLGRDIDAGDPRARTAHVQEVGNGRFRSTAPAWTEEQCDAMLQSGDPQPH